METEISVLEKGLDFALIQSKLKMDLRMDYELRIDFDNFCNYIRTKWYFRNKPLKDFYTKPVFLLNFLGDH